VLLRQQQAARPRRGSPAVHALASFRQPDRPQTAAAVMAQGRCSAWLVVVVAGCWSCHDLRGGGAGPAGAGAVPSWPVVVAPNAELVGTATLRGREIQLQIDTGSAVSWVVGEHCWLRTLDPSSPGRVLASERVRRRATLPLDVNVSSHEHACAALAEGGLRYEQLWRGAEVMVQGSEALAEACVAHRGKSWAGAVAVKRAPRLGQRGVVKRLDPTKQAVKVRFDSDGQTMWCARTSLFPRGPAAATAAVAGASAAQRGGPPRTPHAPS
jgi:hypothetical protein